MSKYSDQIMEWLEIEGYTHCFFLSGGNVMHLLDSASRKFKCIPFVHEVGAGIAADYFNEVSNGSGRAFVLVSAGPALTNTITSIAAAWTESRELLVIGGQAKSKDLARGKTRQIGFQEINGTDICKPISKASVLVDQQLTHKDFRKLVNLTREGRKGPVFLEFCLDVTTEAAKFPTEIPNGKFELNEDESHTLLSLEAYRTAIVDCLKSSKRPVILLGGGVPRREANKYIEKIKDLGLPIATTFNGSDRISGSYQYYAGRPNWYGSRWSNLILQQSDLVIAIGTRLGLLQTGYNHEEFLPLAKLIQVDIDDAELTKGFPKVDIPINVDSISFLEFFDQLLSKQENEFDLSDWQEFVVGIRREVSIFESENQTNGSSIELNYYLSYLFNLSVPGDMINPCSSGSTYESAMRILVPKDNQLIVTSHALASMGFGLTGGIGLSLAHPERRTIILEGDGGFAQNFQELSTVKANNLNTKVFIMDNRGYGSIRRNQAKAFDGRFIGCDFDTGLQLPDWVAVGNSYGIKTIRISKENYKSQDFLDLFNSVSPAIFVVDIDPLQSNFPQILSRQDDLRGTISNPLHEMYPPMDLMQSKFAFKYFRQGNQSE